MLEKIRSLKAPRGPLDPIDRFSEIMFGLIMTLSFTGTISVAEHGQAEIRTLLAAALGCNIAWGIVDGVMFWLTRMAERSRRRTIGDTIRKTSDPAAAQAILTEVLPEEFEPLRKSDTLLPIIERIRQHRPQARPPLITRDDITGAFLVCILVILSTFPVVLPFLFISEVWWAMKISNAIAITSLFLLGISLGRFSGQRKIPMGIVMVLIGILLIVSILQLGG